MFNCYISSNEIPEQNRVSWWALARTLLGWHSTTAVWSTKNGLPNHQHHHCTGYFIWGKWGSEHSYYHYSAHNIKALIGYNLFKIINISVIEWINGNKKRDETKIRRLNNTKNKNNNNKSGLFWFWLLGVWLI